MVFVKFHNMKQKKNSNVAFKLKLKNFHFTTSQNNITITVHKCSVFFSSFFNLCTVHFSKKIFFNSFFFFYMPCSTMFKFLFFFFSLSFFHCPVTFCFCFCFHFFSFFFIINCSFNVPLFFNPISTSLCLYLNTITIGSLPSLFNFSLYFRKIKTFLNSLRVLFFFSLHKISRLFFF